jgi:hypothetical protein
MKTKHIFPFALLFLVMGCKHTTQTAQSSPPVLQPIVASTWDKVRISTSGEIFVNKKLVGMADFVVECQRLKKAGGAAMIYTEHGDQDTTKVQIEVIIRLLDEEVPFKQALKESDLG